MNILNRVAGACALAVLLSSVTWAADQRAAADTDAGGGSPWVQTWGAAPLPPSEAMGPFPASPSFSNQTIRQTVRVSLGGRRIRIRFSNEYGAKPLMIGAASVALASAAGAAQGPRRPVTFSGQRSVLVPAGAPMVSDPIDLPVSALGSLSISLYVPGDTGPCTCHQTGAQTAYISDSGNFVDGDFTPKSTSQYREFLSGVDVEAARGARSVVVLADSISDGVGATPDANHRWPDLLADRLDAHGAKVGWGVVNMGISGNQLLTDGMGTGALARFDRDVLAVPGVKALIVFLGVNDLGMGFGPVQGPMAKVRNASPDFKLDAGTMIAGYRQLIARAHAHGIKVFGATITPYDGASYYTEQGEALRQAINSWIRTGHEYDGVLDFDAAWRDPAHPTQIRAGWTIDHLHGNDVGYTVLADSIDLSLFR